MRPLSQAPLSSTPFKRKHSSSNNHLQLRAVNQDQVMEPFRASTMDSIFCCESIRPYRSQVLSHEWKFTSFMKEVISGAISPKDDSAKPSFAQISYVVQVVRQINFGSLEWKRYFAHRGDGNPSALFLEVAEEDLLQANFKKLNSYKNFKCIQHNKFFELNLYEKDPVNQHHWRANIARPAADIDLPTKAVDHPRVGESASAFVAGDVAEGMEQIKLEGNQEHKEEQAANSKKELDEHKEHNAEITDESFTSHHVSDDDQEWDEDADDRLYGDRSDRSESPQSEKDYTACSSSDCGYCGHCSY